jgi:erythromycin esterase-like protein
MTILRDRLMGRGTEDTTALVRWVRERGRPLKDARDLDPLMERIGDARFVLLGEASHGTAEYYTWRTAISQRLIREKGFSFIAVEGDWPDCYQVNRYVKGAPEAERSAYDVLHAFDRWPTWMWANEEIVALAEWLRGHNDGMLENAKVGFYGLDVYSLWASMRAVIDYLERTDPDAVRAAWQAFRCFEPYGEDVQQYALATRIIAETCEDEVVALLAELRRNTPDYREQDREAFFDAEQNALVAKNAEHYYRTMVRGGAASWNVRDRHMVETLERLMQHHGPRAKAIVWEHNTHIGDARATDMARTGMVNVGQLVREAHGTGEVVLVGFASHRGSVIAATAWEAPMQRMPVPAAREASWEEIMHRAGPENRLLILRGAQEPAETQVTRGHRAIGVVYDPAYEAFGNYVPSVLPRRYDAFLYLDETQALHPLHLPARVDGEVPETFPTGV